MLKVLIVDDEQIIRRSMETSIKWTSFGCEVVATARNGSEAYQFIIDNYPDIIITDIKMPVMDGLELIEKVRLLDGDVEFIVLSGYDDFSLAQRAMRFGVKYYLLKPTNKTDLINTMQQVVQEITTKRDSHRNSLRQLVRAYGASFQKGLLLELLNTRSISARTLARYMITIDLKEVTSAYLITLHDVTTRQITHPVVSDLYALNEQKMLHFLVGPITCDGKVHAVLYIEDIKRMEAIQEYLESRGSTITQFTLNTLEQTFLTLLHTIEGCKEILLYDQHGRSESILNDFGFLRKIAEVGEEAARAIREGGDGEQNLQELNRRMEGCSIDEMKSIFFSLLTILEGEEIDMIDDHLLSLIRNATDSVEILEGIQRLFFRQLSVSSGGESYPIRTIKEYIKQNIDSESISLKWIAENRIGMNVGYLSKLFYKEVGLRFSDYLNRERIDYAKRLMRVYHGSTVQEIAQQVGFGNNPRYFSQVFKKYEGETPSDYLGQYKEEES